MELCACARARAFVPKYQCAEPARDSLTEKEIYPAAIYWSVVTITSVGYGDITAQNPDEMCIATIFLLMSACLWAYIIGNATAIVSTGDPDAIAHHQTMDALNKVRWEAHNQHPNKQTKA